MELKNWEEIRKNGLISYILYVGTLKTGILTLIYFVFMEVWDHGIILFLSDLLINIIVAVCLSAFLGTILGLASWIYNEIDFNRKRLGK